MPPRNFFGSLGNTNFLRTHGTSPRSSLNLAEDPKVPVGATLTKSGGHRNGSPKIGVALGFGRVFGFSVKADLCLLLVAVYLLQPFQQRVDESVAATERSCVREIITTDGGQRNAEFVSPPHDSLLGGMQHFCQFIEADASERLLQD